MYRSTLFIPSANARARAKAATLACDALIFDLEDAVGETEWADALAGLVTTLEAGGFAAAQVMVRIQPLHMAATFDVMAHLLRNGTLTGIVIPKVESDGDIQRVADALPHRVDLWAMIETPLGVTRLGEIAALPLKGLIAGPNDLRKGLRSRPLPARQDIQFALSQIVLYARAYGLTALDGVYNQYTDEDGFAAQCEQGRSLGFDGKTLIHPSQVAGAERAFSPSDAEIAWAQAVVEAFASSAAGVVQLNGEMVERLHLQQAEAILAQRRDR